jgi:hypothetical protein
MTAKDLNFYLDTQKMYISAINKKGFLLAIVYAQILTRPVYCVSRENDFVDHSFQMEDIFFQQTIDKLKNESKFILRKVRSEFLGQCFTVQYREKVGGNVFDVYDFVLKRNVDITLFVHELGYEFWLLRLIFPKVVFSRISMTVQLQFWNFLPYFFRIV